MHAPIKLLFWLFAGTGILLTVLVALLFLVDANVYRDRIEQHVSSAFGRKVVLEGPLSLEPSLTPRFVVNGLKISNPDWAERPFLATVDKFDIRISLLPLLRGDLQIVALEFHGVDLLLEKTADGSNNFTFSESGDPAGLPAIERLSLYDAAIAYAAPDRTIRRLHMEQVTARKVPGQPVEVEAHTTVNALPVTLSLRGEPLGNGQLHEPWRFTLHGEAGDTALRVEGSIADPGDWSQGKYRLDLRGRQLDELQRLSGYTFPTAGPYKLAANIAFSLHDHLTIDNLGVQLGGSDMRGNLHWDFAASPPVIRARLASETLNTGDMSVVDPLTDTSAGDNTDYLDQPFEIGIAGTTDVDIEIRVQQLEGLEKPVQDIVLAAHADRQQLKLVIVDATVNDTHISAKTTVPWGDRLTTLAAETTSLGTLLQYAELDIQAHAPETAYRYTANLMGNPLDLAFSKVEVTARPGAPLSIRANAALNNKPVTLDLKGEPLATLLQQTGGPWHGLTLEVRGEDIRLDADGSVGRPLEVRGFDIEYSLGGADIAALLPLQGAWSITGHYADYEDRSVFDKLKVRVGRSDIGGRAAVYRQGSRTRLVANLDASRIDLEQILPDSAGSTNAAGGEQPLDIGGLAAIELDTEVSIQRLEGLARPMQNIRLHAHSSAQTLTLAPVRATLDGAQVDGRLQLPWGQRLEALGQQGISIQGLLRLTDVELGARLPEGKLQQRTHLMGHPLDVELTGLKASARPGEAVQIKASALLDDRPVQINLQAEPLAQLLQRPTGPWLNLELKMQLDDMHFAASGSVEQPLEARGFEIRYALRGADISALLPMFNLLLPLEGAYSLTGHFADQIDRLVFDELEIKSGDNDISGDISVYQDKPRPRVVANLSSEQIYLGKLLPVSATDTAAGAERRLIPDYDLPIERIREIDGELTFKGKRLRTTAGDLGDISFKATLKDGVLKLDPFTVRGWAGAYIESDGLIDASQEPPVVQWNWVARQLNYGVLLEQAGFAETVQGTIDVTLRLSGEGRTRHEFLGNADGQLIIVGQEGRFGSRNLDLWGSALVTTMLSREWRREDVTDLNCMVARINIEDGIASSDTFIVDTQRVTIAASGTLDLESEALNVVFAPRPKRTTLVSLANPAHVTGTLVAPEVSVTVLPRNRIAAAGTGMLAGLVNPGYLIFTFSQTRSGQTNPCTAAVREVMAMQGTLDQADGTPTVEPKRFSFLPGCTRFRRRPAE